MINVSGGHASASGPIESLTAGFKNTEIISILKRRNNSTENVNENLKYTTASGSGVTEKPPSIHSQTYSDTSLQRYDVDIGDDDDDEDDDDDDESDSDWEALQVSNYENQNLKKLYQFYLHIKILDYNQSDFRIVNKVVVDLIYLTWQVHYTVKLLMFLQSSK